MPHHVVIRLPDGRVACADHRESIVRQMRKINNALSQSRQPDPALYAMVGTWLAGNREQSATCHAGLSPAGVPCGHD